MKTTAEYRPGRKKPWSLRGREAEIGEYRDSRRLTYAEIAILVGATDEGVRKAYLRFKATAGDAGASS